MNKRIRKKKAKQQLIRAISGLVEAAEEMQREQERRTRQAGISSAASTSPLIARISCCFAFFFLIRLFILYPPANLLRQLRNSQIPRPALRLQDGGASAFPCQRRFSCQSRKGTCTSGVW